MAEDGFYEAGLRERLLSSARGRACIRTREEYEERLEVQATRPCPMSVSMQEWPAGARLARSHSLRHAARAAA